MESSRGSARSAGSFSSGYFSQYAPPPPFYHNGQALVPFHPPVVPGYPFPPHAYPPPGPINGQNITHQYAFANRHLYPIEDASPVPMPRPLPGPAFQATPAHKASSELSTMAAPHARHASDSSLLTTDTQSPFSIPIGAPEVTKSLDKVALPSEMSIGSLVHHQTPPTCGVAKIANIPYSITKQEIVQFFGRQARLIAPDKGCPVHIIMERSTAKTMDCYAEFDTPEDAHEAVTRINRICETGRAPRLGNRHVDVEVSSQDELLKDLFPRAKCIVWKDGIPVVMPNIDPYSSGFAGFFTSEEMVGAIRHAEIPHRSPFCVKCPQRTYESTISTLGKFPWYATRLYTVHDRNQLFELVNRQIKALVARMKKTNTIGLDQRLLRDLLYSGLKCPAFNERMKYTLCTNTEDYTEIMRFPDMGKWFPFDTLVKMPKFDEPTLLYYVNLISKGTYQARENPGLPNSFPHDGFELDSPYGPIWFEWPQHIAKNQVWEDAVQQEMVILCNLVMSGWINVNDRAGTPKDLADLHKRLAVVSVDEEAVNSTDVSPPKNRVVEEKPVWQDKYTWTEIYATPSRRASESIPHSRFRGSFSGSGSAGGSGTGTHSVPFNTPSNKGSVGGVSLGHHRNTLSSPNCLGSMQFWENK